MTFLIITFYLFYIYICVCEGVEDTNQRDSQTPHIWADVIALSGGAGVDPFRLQEHNNIIICCKHTSCLLEEQNMMLTAMYGLQPASLVLAMESTSCPLMPKSHSLMLPFLSRRMLEGLMSEKHGQRTIQAFTSDNDTEAQKSHCKNWIQKATIDLMG